MYQNKLVPASPGALSCIANPPKHGCCSGVNNTARADNSVTDFDDGNVMRHWHFHLFSTGLHGFSHRPIRQHRAHTLDCDRFAWPGTRNRSFSTVIMLSEFKMTTNWKLANFCHLQDCPTVSLCPLFCQLKVSQWLCSCFKNNTSIKEEQRGLGILDALVVCPWHALLNSCCFDQQWWLIFWYISWPGLRSPPAEGVPVPFKMKSVHCLCASSLKYRPVSLWCSRFRLSSFFFCHVTVRNIKQIISLSDSFN